MQNSKQFLRVATQIHSTIDPNIHGLKWTAVLRVVISCIQCRHKHKEKEMLTGVAWTGTCAHVLASDRSTSVHRVSTCCTRQCVDLF